MDWLRQIDAYCERLDAGLWAEPLNALSNAAFLVAAFLLWRRVRRQGVPLAVALCAILAVIGISSAAFHTYAVALTAAADTLSILVFVLVYLFAANRDFWGLRFWLALGLTALFFPYAAVTVPLFLSIPALGDTAAYAPVPLLIAAYALLLRRRAPATARGLALGAGILVASLTLRTLDEPLCSLVPTGTHFLWHILNAVMLGWMIEVYRRAHTIRNSAG